MNKKRILGICLITIGIILLINSQVNLLGAVIGIQILSSDIGAIFSIAIISLGLVILLESRDKKTQIGDIVYDEHALKRMEDHHIYPAVVNDAINHGEHYRLSRVYDDKETRGATDAYIRREVASMAPGKGRIGQKIIKVEPGKSKAYLNVVVLTGRNGEVKTALLDNNKELDKFMSEYVERKREKAA
jgi:hypothetical protein